MSEKDEGLIDILIKNERILKSEYQRGFAEGGKDMNEKWLITRKEIIGEFFEFLKNLPPVPEVHLTAGLIVDEIKKWEARLKE